ncbi:hypothetical protein K435DRAFT_871606 [Dendrothele bispora CBS 962.96]|uniref:Uncharacterized protein n=1 Tax=Dendrothele bispora (strain CBS 962.96) TaxID=1314807 RepID=A0A4V4HCJ5_DENBC|nr:hypothetical protein K435DRAFT_871606 [Dendrothele bispora CBS 962.96]
MDGGISLQPLITVPTTTLPTSTAPVTSGVVIYYTNKSDPSARYAKTSSGFLFRGTFHISRLLTKCSQGGGSKRSSRSFKMTANSGPTRIYQTPAGSIHVTSCCNSRNSPSGDGARWCAVGDSAVVIDDLASQGIVMSMKTGSFRW